MSYIGTEPKDIRSFGRTKFDYTASQGQTAFTGADDDGKVLAFTTGQINVYVNGILMDDSDFTTTGTGTVTLASAANLNDVVNIVSFESNIPDNDYVPASGGTFTGAVTHSGNVTFSGTTSGIDMNGTELVLDADGDTGITADTDDRIDFKIAGSDRGNLHYDGNDFFSLESNDYLTLVQNQTAERGLILGPTYFKPYNAHDNTLDLGIGAARWKDLYLSGGAYIGGTGSANYLDDYEEGTFTPSFTSGVASGSHNHQFGFYTKVGRVVHFELDIQASTTANGDIIKIDSLPFTSASTTRLYANAQINYQASFLSASYTGSVSLHISSASTTIAFYTSAGGTFNGTDANNINARIIISGRYFTA